MSQIWLVILCYQNEISIWLFVHFDLIRLDDSCTFMELELLVLWYYNPLYNV